MTTKPKVGDKVRVTSQLVVKREFTNYHPSGKTRFSVEDTGGKTRLLYWPPGDGTTIEIIEPAYVEGGVYLDNDGDLYVYKGGGLFLVNRFNGVNELESVADTWPTTPVLKLGG